MKKLHKLFFTLTVLVGVMILPTALHAQACSVSVSIATGGTASSSCNVPKDQEAFVQVTGTWVGQTTVDRSEDAGNTWAIQESTTANANFKLAKRPAGVQYRVRFASRTSGTVTGSITSNVAATAKLKYPTLPVGSVAYSSLGISVVGSITSSGVSDLFVTDSFTSTGGGILVGATGGTDKFVLALFDSSGALVANTDTAGTTVSATANAFQEIAWTAPVTLPRGIYYLFVQINGTTATFRRPASSTFVDLRTKSVTSTTFGTVPPVIVTPTSMETSVAAGGTNAVGPIGYVY